MAAGVDWVKELQRKVFEECVSQDRRCPDSTDSAEGSLRDVPVSVILANVHRSFAEIPRFRQRSNFLGELKKSLLKVARDKRINWFDFRESSERWFIDLANLLQQDGNNNIRLNHSNVPKEISEENRHAIEEPSCSDTIDEESNASSIDKLHTVASSYSLNSSGTEFNTTDSTVESSGETRHLNEDVDVDVDLKVRIRRFNEENDSLRDELLRADETISTLERNKKLTQTALDQVNNKYSWLLKEHEEQKEILVEAKRREESCKLDLRKLEKANRALQKKVEELESQKENISSLKAKIDRVVKKNTDYTKQLSEIKIKYDEKIIQCEYLQEEFNELQNNHNELQKCFEKNLEHHQEKMEELQLLNAELHSELSNNSDTSKRFPVTPPLYSHSESHTHSTPYQKVRQDSLFSELKATGFSFEDSKIQELKQELSFYNEEISNVAEQVDEALQEIAAYRNEIYVPNVQLVETNCIQTLKLKITTLLDLVKKITTAKAPAKPTTREDARCEKPDVLPSQSKRIGILTDDQLFGTDKPGNDLISSITSSISTYRNENVDVVDGRCDKSPSPLVPIVNHPEDFELSEAQPPEVIVPIVEALNRIIELKNEEENNASKCSRLNPKLKSIQDKKKVVDWSDFGKKISKANVNAKGDDKCVLKVENCSSPELKIDTTSNMKTLKSDISKPNPDERLASKIDTRFVTIRENTYLLDPVVSSTEEKSSLEQSKLCDTKHETSYFTTPLHTPKDTSKVIPRRKLSVYTRSFDVENLQTPDSAQCSSSEKKRSISTPDVQESDLANIRAQSIQPLENSITSNPLLTTYRCTNNSDSSLSPSPTKKDSIESRNEYSFLEERKHTINKPVILAPTKFHLPDSTVNKTITIEKQVAKSKPAVVPSVLQKKSLFEFVPEHENAQQSIIISGSSNLMNKNIQQNVSNGGLKALDLSYVDSSKVSNLSMASTIEVSSSDKSVGSMDISDSVLSADIKQNDKTYTKRSGDRTYSKGESAEADAASAGAPTAPVKASVAVTAAAIVSRELGAGDAAPVARAMSSGEDSSVESECDVSQPPDKSLASTLLSTDTPPAQTNLLEQPLVPRRRSNSCTDPPTRDPELQAVIDRSEKNSCQKATSESPSQEVKNDEIPKAFPSWTDEKLQESGIASFPDMDSELSENLTEDELKKKCAAFSVGLGIDRMTLTKRLILSRRQRDQAEKNFTNEVTKMHQDITDLELLCVDHESMERVHRVDEQLEMVTRCAYRISCSAETLGAVHQERRVSRAVLLADKYLQTLRVKCEKFAAELVETKKVLAENNIMLEENLSELGDDVPRVRYRAVPNNNRTMMARRRASIATISRPLMGSNQDISKDAPRQRNSVSGRVPSLRRPSLCFETPKIDSEKLDRTDSSSSIREIFEQTESRRHSREENNNLIRTSINNLSTITGEHTEEEEEEIWSNTREEIAPESTNDTEINFLDLRHQYRHPIVCWISDKYINWKPMIWGILVAFLLGIFMDRVVSSSKCTGPPISWWSIEEILNQYIQVTNAGHPVHRPI